VQALLTVIGTVLLITGLIFMGQGAGYFPYPAGSFMISQTRWIYYGAAIAVAGVIIMLVARHGLRARL
jgi:hypothetical protein